MGSLQVSSLGEHPQKQPPQCSKARAGTGTMGQPAETPQPAQDLQRQALRCALRRGGGPARGLRGRRLRCFLRGQPERGELEPGLAAPTQAQAPRPVWDALAGPCFGSKPEKGWTEAGIRLQAPGPPRGVGTLLWRGASSHPGRIQLGRLLQRLRRDENVVEEP